jgi:peroxiredoxin Q/BCP
MKKLAIALLATAALALGLFAADLPAVGSMAPNFTLPNNDGQKVQLSDYHGKWVVLYFYPADFTSGCTLEAHNFQQDQPKFDALNAVILGVSVQDVDSHKKFCTKEGLTFHLLADTERKVSELYGTLGTKPYAQYGLIDNRDTFLIDPTGKIVKVYTHVNPGVHSAEVQEALKAAQSGM